MSASGMASVEEIDAINILQATFLAMTRAVEALGVEPAAYPRRWQPPAQMASYRARGRGRRRCAPVDMIFADPPYNLQLGGDLNRPTAAMSMR
jgi:16S rRNA G966 N2-methylase RsmD